MLHLNYTGDVRHIVGEAKGPDAHRAYYRAVEASFDPETGKTRVGFRPVTMPELEALAFGRELPSLTEAATP